MRFSPLRLLNIFAGVAAAEHCVRERLINPRQPEVSGEKFRLKEIERIFFTTIRKFKLWKRAKLLNLRFSRGMIFFKL